MSDQQLHFRTAAEIAVPPLPARTERGEGWGGGVEDIPEIVFPSPGPSPHSFVVGRGHQTPLPVVAVSSCTRDRKLRAER